MQFFTRVFSVLGVTWRVDMFLIKARHYRPAESFVYGTHVKILGVL